MKCIAARLELAQLLSKLQGVVPTKSTSPILHHVLLEATEGQLICSATDGVMSMRSYMQAEVEEEGSIALPARGLLPLVRELTAPVVEIHTTGAEGAHINSGSSRFKLQGLLAEEFPPFPQIDPTVHFDMSAQGLKELFTRALFSAAKVDTHNTLNALCLEQQGAAGTLTSTDGKRLTRIHFTTGLLTDALGSYLIPLKAAEEVLHILDTKAAEPITITLMRDKMAFELPSTTLVTTLFASSFPDVTRLIPHTKPHPLALHKEELIALLKQVSLFTPDPSAPVRLSFTTGELHISAQHATQGEGCVSMPVNYAGEPMHIALNPGYMLDILRHVKDETVHLTLTDAYNPSLFTDSSSAQFVVMPMRLP